MEVNRLDDPRPVAVDPQDDRILNAFLFATAGLAVAGGTVSPERRQAMKEIFDQVLGCTLPDAYVDDAAGQLRDGGVGLYDALAEYAPALGDVGPVIFQAAVLVMMAGDITPAEQDAIQAIIGGLGLSREDVAAVFTEMHAKMGGEA